ncbi:MAG: HD-GYP domain-containing protein [Bdellovibrio sp.]
MTTSSGRTVDVLLGSPNERFLETMKGILKGYYPYKLQHFKSADEVLEKAPEHFNPILAIIDGTRGTQATIEWVQSTKMNFPDCPLIVLHSAAAPLDFNLVKKNGADEVMHINFDREFISDMVLQLAPIDMEGDSIPITALMPVDLRDIEAGLNINFDIYVHLPANHRSVVLRRSGDIVDQKQVDKFKNLHQQMYVKKTQLKPFFEYARTVMSLRNVNFPISMTEKFQRSKRNIYEFMAQFLNSASTDYQEGKAILDKCKDIIADLELNKNLTTNEVYEEVCRYTGNIRSYYHDCLCVSAYAAYFAQLLDWSAEKREAAAIAGLLHNVGLSQMTFDGIEKKFTELSAEDQKAYKYYPERSVNLVKAKKVPLTQEMTDGILQHRESVQGNGFPKALPAKDISDFGKLLAIAYSFHEATALRDTHQAAPPQVAIAALKDHSLSGNGAHDLVMITTIAKKFKP